jgi:mono/diheme cytochrome c family protein
VLHGPDCLGRVDTFNPYKAIQFKFPMSPAHVSEVALNVSSDYPSIWQQAPRNGLFLHWDGNNPSVDERNLSAALGAGVTPVTIDHASVQRVRRWMWNLPAPKYSELLGQSIDVARAARGRELYLDYCASCHGSAGSTGYDYSTTRHPQLGKVASIYMIAEKAADVILQGSGAAAAPAVRARSFTQATQIQQSHSREAASHGVTARDASQSAPATQQ